MSSLQELVAALSPLQPTVVYPARAIVTMDDSNPAAQAVAVHNGRIVAVGALDQVVADVADSRGGGR
jgi:predicted amidohydrolase YtcJ